MLCKMTKMGIYVKDQNEALRFYTEKLGFEIREDMTMGNYRWLTVGLKTHPDFELNLSALQAGGPLNAEDVEVMTRLVEGGKMSAGVWVTDNIQQTYEDYKARGVEFITPPTERPYGETEAVFKDNSGNFFVLHQDKK